MALTESQRRELYELVKQSSLGQSGADLIMNAIPPITWSDVATHDDLALLRSDLRAEMAELRSDLRGEMADLRGGLRAEMADLRGGLRAEMADLRGGLRAEMADLRGEMAELRSDFKVEMTSLEARLQRSIITWILAAQGVTLATITVLITVAMIVIA